LISNGKRGKAAPLASTSHRRGVVDAHTIVVNGCRQCEGLVRKNHGAGPAGESTAGRGQRSDDLGQGGDGGSSMDVNTTYSGTTGSVGATAVPAALRAKA